MWRITIASLVLAVSAFAQQAPAAQQAPTICGNSPLCYEASDFAATVTDFRTSVSGGYKLMDVTVRFTNKTNGVLILGYANGSGTATDERGNRYAPWGGNALRGMGYVNGQQFDPKFQLRPGSYGDARFELLLQGNPQVLGFTFELDLTVNEINSFTGNQYTLGGEFPLMWKGLQNGAAGAAPGQVAVAGGAAGGTAGTVTSIPCQNSSVQNVANGANNATSTVTSAVSSIGSLFGKKQQPQAAAASGSPTVPCTPATGATAATGATGATGATTATTSTGAVVTKPATTAGATAGAAAKTVMPAAATKKPTTLPATQKPAQPAPAQPAPAQPASTQPKPSSP